MTLFELRVRGINSALGIKAPCRVATTANITLSGFQTIDGVTLADGDANLRVLVKNQTDGTQNGLYDANANAWTRCPDLDSADDLVTGTAVIVANGTVGPGIYVMTAAWNQTTSVVGTSTISFAQAISTL